MGILFWIIFSGLVGWVASLVMGTDSQQGIIINIVVGVIGALVLIVIVKAVTGRQI